ncbi:WD40 repeat domain-containing protein [Micromonospora sp. DR5-3]|uniref:WD40 repeat domain-containing protein n=1 Tax=unclassified Micromonospora TaxID=2617518 RepID=UPI0011D3C86D|nr:MULTISPECIES: WD40 repeat domain-containing protein [unclassified Micromonospora]MCW3813240.1 WD40 repeat domain-containing protein [Micromonospora sp. DR5-3]TYC24634.1 hypothetical protein FXF52_08660 [Micromonospora sp. MP36]
MSDELRSALRDLGERMPPARLPADLWATGRRQRRRARLVAVAAAAAAVLACAAVPVALTRVEAGPAPAAGQDAVPAEIGLPYMWQATVAQDPPGPAAVLFSGGGLGLRGIDPIDDEGKVAVVGRDGRYRTLLYGGAESAAGEDVQLSPDGRYVADSGEAWLRVTDLTDGSRRVYDGLPDSDRCCPTPVTWAPDGRSIVVLDTVAGSLGLDADGQDIQRLRLVLVDLDTGAARMLAEERSDRWRVRTASLGAFSPDGTRIVTTIGDTVSLRDRTGRAVWSRNLGPRRVLAGSGAVSPDGTRIATVELDGCLTRCDAASLGARSWRFGWLDAATGQDTDGPALAPVRGQAVRALGWRTGTDLVVLRYEPNPHDGMATLEWNDTGYWETGHVQLMALRPDGGRELLLDPPAEVCALDVARDLLTAGRFGGPAVGPRPFPARPVIVFAAAPYVMLLAALLGAVLLWRRRRRRGPVVRSSPVPDWQRPVGTAGPSRRTDPPDPPWPPPAGGGSEPSRR